MKGCLTQEEKREVWKRQMRDWRARNPAARDAAKHYAATHKDRRRELEKKRRDKKRGSPPRVKMTEEEKRDALRKSYAKYYASERYLLRCSSPGYREKRLAISARWERGEGRLRVETLGDNYVKKTLCHRTHLHNRDIPADLVELQRASIKMKRQLRQICQSQKI